MIFKMIDSDRFKAILQVDSFLFLPAQNGVRGALFRPHRFLSRFCLPLSHFSAVATGYAARV